MATAVQQEEAIVCADQQVDPPQSSTQYLSIELPLVLADLRRLGEGGEEEEGKQMSLLATEIHVRVGAVSPFWAPPASPLHSPRVAACCAGGQGPQMEEAWQKETVDQAPCGHLVGSRRKTASELE